MSNNIVKIILVGNRNVGKSSILYRYCENRFKNNIPATIGIDLKIKEIQLKTQEMLGNEDGKLIMQIWDTSGNEKFRSIILTYFRSAKVVVFVYDQNNKQSFIDLSNWIDIVRQETSNNHNIAIIIVASKCELPSAVNEKEVYNFVSSLNNYWNIVKFTKVSAKTGEGISELFSDIIGNVIANLELDKDIIYLNSPKQSIRSNFHC